MQTLTRAGIVWVAVVLASCSTQRSENVAGTEPVKARYTETFMLTPPDKIVLEQYAKMSDEHNLIPPVKAKEITETGVIGEITALTSTLPDSGQIMKKMADVALLKTTLIYSDDTIYFEYYEQSVKTPATSFYANPPQDEKKLYDRLVSLLEE